jgi:hypothetical protein
MTEHDAIRADQLHAAERVTTLAAVPLPVALTLPLQWLAAGPRAIVASAMTAVIGLLWVEALLYAWRRIPFTCWYTPGKRPAAQWFLLGLAVFFAATIGSVIETASLRGSSTTIGLIVAILTGLVLVLRRRRQRKWRATPPRSTLICPPTYSPSGFQAADRCRRYFSWTVSVHGRDVITCR